MTAPSEHEDLIPRPPKARTTVDFVVILFVILIFTILLGFSVATIIAFLFTDKDVSPFAGLIADLVTTMIAALIGFLAGKGNRT